MLQELIGLEWKSGTFHAPRRLQPQDCRNRPSLQDKYLCAGAIVQPCIGFAPRKAQCVNFRQSSYGQIRIATLTYCPGFRKSCVEIILAHANADQCIISRYRACLARQFWIASSGLRDSVSKRVAFAITSPSSWSWFCDANRRRIGVEFNEARTSSSRMRFAQKKDASFELLAAAGSPRCKVSIVKGIIEFRTREAMISMSSHAVGDLVRLLMFCECGWVEERQ